MKDRIVVITGASSGIGEALARQVHALGGKPVLIARRADVLATVATACGGRWPSPPMSASAVK